MPPSPAKAFLDLAARLALRAEGDVEPNPMVGAVIVGPGGDVIGMGHHRRYGGPHAERDALADCRRRGRDPRGAAMYVTLEPCNAHGKQPPCTAALIEAGIARVIIARPDPSPGKGGGGAALRAAGIDVETSSASPLATRLAEPFVHRTRTGIPWVIAKWAQRPDGEMRFGADGSRWITGEPARRRVHRMRARVDAIVTGMGTVRADDPLLTARHVARVRRTARRVVVARDGRLPPGSNLARTADEAPVAITMIDGAPPPLPVDGVEIVPVAPGPGGVDLESLLLELAPRFDTSTVMIEAGPTLLEAFAAADLINEAVVFVAGVTAGRERPRLVGSIGARMNTDRWDFIRARRTGPDAEFTFRRVYG